MKRTKVPTWAKLELTKAERETLAYCVLCDGAPSTSDDRNEIRRLNYRLRKLQQKGVIAWNEDGVFLTELGRYIAMRNPATEPTSSAEATLDPVRRARTLEMYREWNRELPSLEKGQVSGG